MRILIVGSGEKYSKVSSYKRAFVDMGYEVDLVGEEYLYRPSFINRLVNKFLPLPFFWGVNRLNKVIIERVEKFLPDLVILFKPIFIKTKTINELKKNKSLVFSYHSDNAWLPINSSTYYVAGLNLYDALFFQNRHNADEAKKNINIESIYLPSAVDTEIHYPVKVYNGPNSDIAFIGTYIRGEKREVWLEKLCQLGYNLKIYGSRWEKCKNRCLKNRKIINGPKYGRDFSEVVNSTKIVINFLREHNNDEQNSRTYELPACGGFMLHERTEEVLKLFKEGKEAEFFSNFRELRDKIDYYLKQEEERIAIAKSGLEKVRLEEYSFKSRAEVIIKEYKKLRKNYERII